MTARTQLAGAAATRDRQGNDGTVGLRDAAALLGVHYMTAYRYVRTGRLTARLVDNQWQILRVDLVAWRDIRGVATLGDAAPRSNERAKPIRSTFIPRLVSCLVMGDETGSWRVIESAMAAGARPSDVYLQLVTPAMVVIGDDWSDGRLSIAEEHLASATTARLIGRIGPRFAQRGHRRGTVVLGCAPDDRHSLATAILADLARGAGFHVLDLGADVPSASFLHATVRAPKVICVGISSSTKGSAANLRLVVDTLRAGGYEGAIMAGGNEIRSRVSARRRGADDWAPNGEVFLAILEELDQQRRKRTQTGARVRHA